LFNDFAGYGSRRALKASAFKHLSVPMLQLAMDRLTELIQKVGPAAARSICIFEAFGDQRHLNLSRESTAFSNRGDWFNATVNPNWADKVEFDDYCRQWARDVVEAWQEIELKDDEVKNKVVGIRAYSNGSLGDEKSQMVYHENYPRLQALKKKYDPGMLFNKWYPILPSE
jgi:FAD/FMN-containing dehydrogenase